MFLSGFFCLKKPMRKRPIFWQKPWTNPFAKCRFFSVFWNFSFVVLKAFISIQNMKKCFFLPFFAQKKYVRKRSIFWQEPWTCKMSIFFDSLRTSLLRSKKLYFLSRISKNVSFFLFLVKKKTYKKKVDFLTKTMH